MYVTCVHVVVKPENREAFIEATLLNQKYSEQEPDNLRFDCLVMTDDPNKFLLYEAYRSEDGALAHKQTEHYLSWREAVADHMAEPRAGVRYDGLL